MGKAKLNGGGNLNVKNGVIKRYFGSETIPANTFVEIKNTGAGEVCVGPIPSISILAQSAMLDKNKVIALQSSGASDYNNLAVGIVSGEKIQWGTAMGSVYGENSFLFVMSPTKVVVLYLADSGYFIANLLTVSGTTITKRTTTSNFSSITGPSYYGAFKISDTQIIVWETGYNGGYTTRLHLLTVSGNNITVTSSDAYKNYYESSTYAMSGHKITDSYFITIEESRFDASEIGGSAENGVYVRLHSISGTSITEVSNAKISGVTDFDQLSEFYRYDDNSIVGLIGKIESNTWAPYFCKITRSGNNLTYKEYPVNPSYKTGISIPYRIPSTGFNLIVGSDYIFVMRVYDGTADFMRFDRNFNLVDENVIAFAESVAVTGGLATHFLGNGLLDDKRMPIVSVFNPGYTSNTTAGAIINYGRLEVKPSESKIDGLTNTGVTATKDGRVWLLGGV